MIVSGPPEYPKLGFDSYEGWLAYYAPTDQLFVKRYAAYRDRGYNEIAGLTASVWYPKDAMVEDRTDRSGGEPGTGRFSQLR